jgi:hypothetical protein
MCAAQIDLALALRPNTKLLLLKMTCWWSTNTEETQVICVPDRRRFGHVDVVSGSKCSHMWMGQGEKGTVGDRQGG